MLRRADVQRWVVPAHGLSERARAMRRRLQLLSGLSDDLRAVVRRGSLLLPAEPRILHSPLRLLRRFRVVPGRSVLHRRRRSVQSVRGRPRVLFRIDVSGGTCQLVCPVGEERCANSCCASGQCCLGICCASGETCCNGVCCPSGETCCNGACCAARHICSNATCNACAELRTPCDPNHSLCCQDEPTYCYPLGVVDTVGQECCRPNRGPLRPISRLCRWEGRLLFELSFPICGRFS